MFMLPYKMAQMPLNLNNLNRDRVLQRKSDSLNMKAFVLKNIWNKFVLWR